VVVVFFLYSLHWRGGDAVTQLVEAMRYGMEGRGFDSR
jgi:hypothetical protein